MLHPLAHVRDHQNPLADTPALASCQAPQLGRPRFAAKKVCRHTPSPKHGTLAHQLYHIWGSPEAGIRRHYARYGALGVSGEPSGGPRGNNVGCGASSSYTDRIFSTTLGQSHVRRTSSAPALARAWRRCGLLPSSIIAPASAFPSRGGNRSPVGPGSTSSAGPPTAEAATASPCNI